MNNLLVLGILLFVPFYSGGPALGQNTQPFSHEAGAAKGQHDAYGEQLGTVQFPVSCNMAASQHAERGLALLHHMTYEGARAAFAAATEADPECAMGYWGQVMSFIHPLWSDPPGEADFKKGQALVKKAETRGKKTQREVAYIAAVKKYYAEGWSQKEQANLAGFEQGWRKVHEQFPDDPEAASFYALANLATADPADKSYAIQKRAAAIAQKVLKSIPDHPGAHHYMIHAYDYPPLAEKALEVARHYGTIAPEISHSLHMPSHIFTRLGLWQESIDMNRRSAAAALKHAAGEKFSLHYLHALDYLAYAYLQRGEDQKAKEVLNTIKSLEGPVQAHLVSAYALVAIPARVALERQQWAEAAGLKPGTPASFPWEKFPAMEAITYFVRALGAARSDDVEAARQAFEKLEALREQTQAEYWGNQIDIQQLSAKAWLEYQEGKQEEALEKMKMAAEMEAGTEKHPVTPGEVLPARELLADMLLAMGRYQEAHSAYFTALERSPKRFNSLYGAGRAAELEGDRRKAALNYKRLVEIAAKTDAGRERLQQAKAFLAANKFIE